LNASVQPEHIMIFKNTHKGSYECLQQVLLGS